MFYLEKTIAIWSQPPTAMWEHSLTLPDLLMFSREARSLGLYVNVPDFQMLANKIGLQMWPRASTLQFLM